MVIGFLAKLNSNRRNRIDFQKLREEHSGGRKGPILLCNTRTREIDKKENRNFHHNSWQSIKGADFFLLWGYCHFADLCEPCALFIYLFTCVPMNLDEEESSKTKQTKKKNPFCVSWREVFA